MWRILPCVFRRDFGIDAVELVEVDALQPQAAQASFAGFPQVLGPAVLNPAIGARPVESSFCGNHQVRWIRKERLGDDLLTHVRAVRIGGVDEIHAQLDRAPEDANGFLAVFRLAPNAFARQAHGAETEPMNAQVLPNVKLAGLRGARCRGCWLCGCSLHFFSLNPRQIG